MCHSLQNVDDSMFFKWANPGLFLFTFVLFKHKCYRKNCRHWRDSNSVRLERWPLDHPHCPLLIQYLYFINKFFVSVEFGNFFMAVEDPKLSTSNLCPSLKSRHRSSPMTSSASALLWRSARSTFCDQGLAFCWMACLPLEFDCPASEQVSSTIKLI